jgi:RNA polymerase sigma factor (sigma-70 family)
MTSPDQSPNSTKHPIKGVSAVFLECNTFLKKFLARFLNHEQDIEDVVQEVYLKAYSVEKERIIDQPKAFLFSIAKNLALNELNRKSRQMTSYLEECTSSFVLESAATTENENEADQSLGIYCEAVAALPDKCRRVYLLRKVHGLKHKEIAQQLGISLSSVEKHLRNGVLNCRLYMEEHSGEQPPVTLLKGRQK